MPDEIVPWPWHGSWPYKAARAKSLKCNYLLASDNLLDQTHGAYVHKSTLAAAPDDYARAEMHTDPTRGRREVHALDAQFDSARASMPMR